MSGQPTTSTFRRQPHYSFMRPVDFGFVVFLLLFDASLISSFWLWSDSHWGQRLLMSVTLISPTLGYAWLRHRRRNVCADSGELVLSIIIPQAVFQIYSQIHEPQQARMIPVLCLTPVLIILAWKVWRAPNVAKKLEEDLEAIRRSQAEPPFTHIENP